MKYKIHPVCALFPEPSAGQRAKLAESIAAHGQLEPGLTYQGFLIDGKTRLAICEEKGVEFRAVEWAPNNGESMLDAMIAKNLHRRHMTATDCALVAQNAIPLYKAAADSRKKGTQFTVSAQMRSPQETPKNSVSVPNTKQRGKAVEQAAKAAGVSTRTVEHLEKVRREAPDLHAKVVAKDLSLSAAVAAVKDRKAGSAPAKDRTGRPVPEHLRGPFTAGDERFEAVLKAVQQVERWMKEIVDDGLGAHMRPQEVQANIANLKAAVKFGRPYAPCCYCSGSVKGCDACRKTGWVNKSIWDAAPKEKTQC